MYTQRYNTWTLHLVCFRIIATLIVAAGSVSTLSPEKADRDARRAQLQERLKKVRNRLRLTDDQVEQIEPILRSGFEAQARVLRKHGIDLRSRSGEERRLGFRQLRQLRRDLDAVRKQTIEELAVKLNGTQVKEYRKIQEERKRALRKRLRQRRR